MAKKNMLVRQMGSKYPVLIFMVLENGVPGMRIDNAGPFNKRESLKIARWIREAFATPDAARGEKA